MNRSFILIASVAVLGLAALILARIPGEAGTAPSGGAPVPAARVTASADPLVGTGRRAALAASEKRFDFGSISMARGTVTHRYAIANRGSEPLTIRKLYTSCMCTTATLVKGVRQFGPYGMRGHGPIPRIDQTLAPGERAFVDVVFDPAAHGPAGIGPIERVVVIENSAQPPLELAFFARVTP